MASLHTLERRILALEARLAEIEGGYGDTLHKLHRSSVKTDLRLARVLDHLKIADVTEEEVDAVLDEDASRCGERTITRFPVRAGLGGGLARGSEELPRDHELRDVKGRRS